MSIDTEIGTTLSNEDVAHFAAQTEAVTAAIQWVRELHPAYSWAWTDEIRCRGCDASLEIPLLASREAIADEVFRAHQSSELDAVLTSGGLPYGDS